MRNYANKVRTKERGITLIALVVTIIILLILAGITLSTITNQSIITKAKDATNIYLQAEKEEKQTLGEMDEMIANDGERYELTLNKKNAYLIGYEEGKLEELNIPEKVEANGRIYTIVGIDGYTFRYDSKLKKVTIANTIKTIGKSCFSNCRNLEEVYVPASVTSIGNGFTSNDRNLKKIEIDEKNTKYKDIDGVVLSKDGTILIECPQGKDYTNWTMPESVQKIGKDSLSGTNIQSFKISNKITKVGEGAFESCSELKTLEINANIDEIPLGLCYRNYNLVTVKININVKRINSFAFTSCGSLSSIDIPATVEGIGLYSFGECYSLEDITIPSKTKEIGTYAFIDCNKINVSFENYNNLEKIGDYVFSDSSRIVDANAASYITAKNSHAIEQPGAIVTGFATDGYAYEI